LKQLEEFTGYSAFPWAKKQQAGITRIAELVVPRGASIPEIM